MVVPAGFTQEEGHPGFLIHLPSAVVITYTKGKDRPGKVVNPAYGQLTGKINFSLFPFARENLVSRDGFGCSVPCQPAHLNTRAESGAYGIPPEFRGGVLYLFKPPHAIGSVPEFIGSRKWRTDGIHCRGYAGTGQ